MQRHELWRLQYRSNRYMQHLDEAALQQRAKDVFLNLLTITEQNKIGLPPIQEGEEWMVLWTEVLEEFDIRYGPYPAGFENGVITNQSLPLPNAPLAEKAARAVMAAKVNGLEKGSYLVKYINSIFLESFRGGHIRIAPASSYQDPSLNDATRDEELELYIQPHPSFMRLDVIDQHSHQPKGRIYPRGNKIKKRAGSDYYLFCLSEVLIPRLFLDFDKDACVIVKQPGEFYRKVVEAFERQLKGWTAFAFSVAYIDPLKTSISELDIYRQKHFRYAYQRELRFIFLPQRPIQKLEAFTVHLSEMPEMSQLRIADF